MKFLTARLLLNSNLFGTRYMSASAMFLVSALAFAQLGCQGQPFWVRNQGPPPLAVEPDPLAPAGAPYVAPIVGTPGLQLSTEQRFKDVPVPQGVKTDRERTFVYESPGLHVGRIVYTTRASLSDLAQFYITQAPTGQWQLQDTVEAENSVKLQFSKPGSLMAVTVQDLGFAKGRRLTIQLTPDSSGGGL